MEAATVATALGDVDRSGRWLLLISLALIGMVFVLVRRGAFVAAALAAAGALYLRCGFLLKCAGPALLVEAVRPDGWPKA